MYLDRTEDPAAGIGAVAGVDIDVQRAKATRAMIAGAVAQGLDGQTAIFAYKGIVIFRKSFLFHKIFSVIFRICFYHNRKTRFCQEQCAETPRNLWDTGRFRQAC